MDNVRQFLGLSGYYRYFRESFAAHAHPLTQLLKKKNAVFHSGRGQDNSFKALKHALTHAPVLTVPNFKDPLLLQTDASMIELSVVLLQQDLKQTGSKSRLWRVLVACLSLLKRMI